MDTKEPTPKINTVKQLERAADTSSPSADEVLQRIKERRAEQEQSKDSK
jgi:hypothetical protein